MSSSFHALECLLGAGFKGLDSKIGLQMELKAKALVTAPALAGRFLPLRGRRRVPALAGRAWGSMSTLAPLKRLKWHEIATYGAIHDLWVPLEARCQGLGGVPQSGGTSCNCFGRLCGSWRSTKGSSTSSGGMSWSSGSKGNLAGKAGTATPRTCCWQSGGSSGWSCLGC